MTAGKTKTKMQQEDVGWVEARMRWGEKGSKISGLSPHGRTGTHAGADGKTVTA